MKLNVFEGARRIALLLGALWIAGCIAFALLKAPEVTLYFSIPDIGEPPKLVGACGRDDAVKRAWTDADMPANVTLCFTAHRANDGRMLVPYPNNGVSVRMPNGVLIEGVPAGLSKAELESRLRAAGHDADKLMAPIASPESAASSSLNGRYRMYSLGESWSANVSAYADGVADRFAVPEAAKPEAHRRVWEARRQIWQTTSLTCVSVLLLGWMLVAVVGWVVRGFLGIRKGQDSPPPLPPGDST